ncbi:hypothetical protein [Lacticaseibacillus mingshuiensis]|uniref:hypothetical protein n=1 Tax=Lacticaseibacillus mingshuiensis TaxID=2799574 RepID=UPI001CED635F|nr:hypothetical protein [Lacticaseibacillus mingshuiensis]
MAEMTVITIKMGGATRNELRAQLAAAHIQLNKHAAQLLEMMPLYPQEPPYQVRVGLVPIAALGLTGGATLPQIYRAAIGAGLKLAPLALAVFLRLQWRDQPASQDLEMHRQAVPDLAVTVATATPGDLDAPRGFYLRNVAGQLHLRGYVCDDQYWWPGDAVFAFVLN